jgi:hypothetical protein
MQPRPTTATACVPTARRLRASKIPAQGLALSADQVLADLLYSPCKVLVPNAFSNEMECSAKGNAIKVLITLRTRPSRDTCAAPVVGVVREAPRPPYRALPTRRPPRISPLHRPTRLFAMAADLGQPGVDRPTVRPRALDPGDGLVGRGRSGDRRRWRGVSVDLVARR